MPLLCGDRHERARVETRTKSRVRRRRLLRSDVIQVRFLGRGVVAGLCNVLDRGVAILPAVMEQRPVIPISLGSAEDTVGVLSSIVPAGARRATKGRILLAGESRYNLTSPKDRTIIRIIQMIIDDARGEYPIVPLQAS